jgi:diaminopimelate decarboxylase
MNSRRNTQHGHHGGDTSRPAAPHLWPITATLGADGHLIVGGCDTLALARDYGTPLYLLDEATFRANCRAYRVALARHYPGPSSVQYAGKALLNTAVARLVMQEGLGLDAVSGGEVYVALRAGIPPERIHLHGNGKTRAELQQALDSGIGTIMVDNLDELALLARLTAGRASPQAIAFRLTPEIAAETHAHIQTGHAASKFGLPLAALDTAAGLALAAPGLRLHGLHAHLGSQLFAPEVYVQAINVLLDCAARLRARYGLAIDTISPGGGLGVPYVPEQAAPDLDAYAAAVGRALAEGAAARGLPPPRLVVEPGRSIVARAGVALYEVVGRKRVAFTVPRTEGGAKAIHGEPWTGNDGRRTEECGRISAHETHTAEPGTQNRATIYVHIDGGMGDNIRPALYGARYTALLANRAAEAPAETVHISGRYCESGDVLIHDIALPAAVPGDVLAVAAAGAYTLSMASNYNLAPRPALLLVGEGRARLIQRRETYEDLVARDGGGDE